MNNISLTDNQKNSLEELTSRLSKLHINEDKNVQEIHSKHFSEWLQKENITLSEQKFKQLAFFFGCCVQEHTVSREQRDLDYMYNQLVRAF